MSTELPVRLDELISFITEHDNDALNQLERACQLAAALDEQSDHLIGHFVDQARRSGASWSQIGQHMGVSKQAAQKRFVPTGFEHLDPSDITGGQFSRFTARAKVVMQKADLVSRNHLHAAIEPLHLLLGLAEEPNSIACRAIEAQGLAIDALTAAAEAALPADGDTPRPAERAFSDAAGNVLKLTLREALGLGHNYIGTEHMLLGLLASDNPASAVLGDNGITKDASKEAVVAQLRQWSKQNKD
ncbi:MAG TPA: Clp protease N-terminal domain-containing protein [Stackebrandtia sp.]|jgi:hypothetical protein|uniref:Clp protease N-terminal domain-containing protein n=1 Tax=Stackebrandtia sp. TaxID=2023065 RepID=UPI002D29E0FD|nr:Clp protease N-terminal domain-containing protein [Stackebrandtia sp.]HZE40430.1 Clp protease N-terminal domain-containing protein [Stackebrandtia sp.]